MSRLQLLPMKERSQQFGEPTGLPDRNFVDSIYLQRKAEGQPGWGNRAQYEMKLGQWRWFESLCSPRHDGRIVEIGCGAGNILRELHLAGYSNLLGLDSSAVAIEWAIEASDSAIQFQVADIARPDALQRGTIDVVFDTDTLHMLLGADRSEAIKSIAQALRPGGHFLTGLNESYLDSPDYIVRVDGQPRYYWPPSDLFESNMAQRGLSRVHRRELPKRNKRTKAWIEYIFRL